MYVIRKINVSIFARIFALVSVAVYLVPWAITIVFGFLMGLRNSYYSSYGLSRFLRTFGIGMSIFWLVMPLVVWLVSYLAGLLIAWAYNVIAKFWGGIKLEIVLEKDGNQN
jgi:hypothetical protein